MLYAPRLLVIVPLSLFLAACTTYRPEDSGSAKVEERPEYTVVKPRPPVTEPDHSAAAAYRPLLDKADQARARGDYEAALALLERAQRIDSDSADIYLAMARTHRERGDASQARAVAERGLLYCSGKSQCDALRAYAR